MQRIDVRLGVDRHGADSELFASANHAQRDLTTIGNQDFFKHDGRARPLDAPISAAALNHRTRNSTWPNCTGLPFSANTSAMTPLVSALISFITFIASMIQTTESSLTVFPTSTYGAASGEPARRNVP